MEFDLPDDLMGISAPEIGVGKLIESRVHVPFSGVSGDAIATALSAAASGLPNSSRNVGNFSDLDGISPTPSGATATAWRGIIHVNSQGEMNASVSRYYSASAEHWQYVTSVWWETHYLFSGMEYRDWYDLWTWSITVGESLFFTSRKCSQGPPNLQSNQREVGERCPPPLPNLSTYSPKYGKPRRYARRSNQMSKCCDCAAIADMLAQQNVAIKAMFDGQNIEIGESMTDQTKFLQDQMIALAPTGFDYQPIFNKIEDGVVDIWNGLNK
jgi:hypothetical protein